TQRGGSTRQPSQPLLAIGPTSHSSSPLTMPSPQYSASVQSGPHSPYPPSLMPSSHCSPALSTPSPHKALHSLAPPSLATHSNPASMLHAEPQPSPSTVL